MSSTHFCHLEGEHYRINESGCWLWLKAILKNGYPWGYQHRRAWEAVNGPRPAGYDIHHRCKNTACVNPDHLVALSPVEHRYVHKLVEKAGLTLEDVKAIRERGRTTLDRAEDIAAEYGVHVNTIRNYWREARWAELTGDHGRVEPPLRICKLDGCEEIVVSKRRDKAFCCQPHQAKAWEQSEAGRTANRRRRQMRKAA